MKKTSVIILIFSVGFFFFSSCKKSELKAVDADSISLYGCSLKTAGMPYICFDSLITDSRCPESPNVQCFLSGTAIIQVTFHENENTHTFRMSLKGFPSLGYPDDTIINGYNIIFSDLKPYPEYNKPAPKEQDISATINVTP